MATCICSLFLTRETLLDLKIKQPEDTHYVLYCAPAFNSVISSGLPLGVVLSGPRKLQHLVLVPENNLNWNQNNTTAFSSTVTCCEGSLMASNVQCEIQETVSQEELDYVIGIVPHPFKFIGLKTIASVQNSNVSSVAGSISHSNDLLQRVANMHGRPKRKRTVLEPVSVKNIGLLTPQAARNAAYTWIEYHAKNFVIIDFVPKRSEEGKNVSNFRRFRVKNDKGEFVIVRTLRECINHVQERTGHNFWDDMLNNGDQYNLQAQSSVSKVEEVQDSNDRDISGLSDDDDVTPTHAYPVSEAVAPETLTTLKSK